MELSTCVVTKVDRVVDLNERIRLAKKMCETYLRKASKCGQIVCPCDGKREGLCTNEVDGNISEMKEQEVSPKRR